MYEGIHQRISSILTEFCWLVGVFFNIRSFEREMALVALSELL